MPEPGFFPFALSIISGFVSRHTDGLSSWEGGRIVSDMNDAMNCHTNQKVNNNTYCSHTDSYGSLLCLMYCLHVKLGGLQEC